MQRDSLLHLSLPSRTGDRRGWGALSGSSAGLALAEAANGIDSLAVLITADAQSARRLETELRFYGGDLPVLQFPDWETLPYDNFSPHRDIISERLTTLHELPSLRRGVLIVPVATLMHRIAPPDYLLANSLVLDVGQQLDPEALRRRFTDSGYRAVNTVYEHGEYALRGSLIDVYPMGSPLPFRIDLLDDEIDTLRTFDPETQRTIDKVDSVRLLPGKEFPLDEAGIARFRRHWHERFEVDHRRCPVYRDVSEGIAPPGVEYYLPLFFEQPATLFDYLPEDAVVFTAGAPHAAAEHFWRDIHQRYEQRAHDVERPVLAPAEAFLPAEQLFARLKQYPRVDLHSEALPAAAGYQNANVDEPPEYPVDARAADPVAPLRRRLTAPEGPRILLVAESPGRQQSLIELLARQDIALRELAGWRAFVDGADSPAITVAPLEQGLVTAHVEVITEPQLFGRRVLQQRRREVQDQSDAIIKNLTELRVGAPVVHIDHGVGRYRGLETIAVDGQDTEFLTLEYAEEARLYVPVADLHLISRYTGADEALAPLHRLGSDQWSRAKKKAADKIRDVAAELLDIYARRAARQGRPFEAPETDYERFAADFPFEETPDQEQAIGAVIRDMASEGVMDRLVCGDVGFGKTEVAMRAAFLAVHSGTQVAVLVPTTLLAQQHYQSFSDRFAGWPVTVEVTSRFRSAKEQEQIEKRLENGDIDIIIGTHKLLQAGVKYQDLGLVIIDEEHRFGVRQKEKLKSLRSEVDILTLTATPIPRTLNMAMSGMRDLSIIATPPARRLSIKTFVRQRDKGLIREAITREVQRGGQVFFLHNEVKTIDKAARELRELMPELRVAVAHGQMRERELEQVMSDFYHQRFSVLVCSTIIETGIDIPNANTIIIERADKFGLAQLHQLRGRVGRSHHQAYAYLLTPHPKTMTADAAKRLEAIGQAEDLGSGFTLATHDLEIRGAGELLGEEQSGQIQSIGFTLYMEMLERAVEAIKEGRQFDIEQGIPHGAEVNLRLPALIPEDYLPDVHGRLILYKRIANAGSEDELRELQVEMIDRFGLLPEPVKNLFRVTALKLRAQGLGIERIEAGASGGKLEFAEQPRIDASAVVQLVQSKPATYQLAGATTLKFQHDMEQFPRRFEFVETLLDTLTPRSSASSAA